MDFEEWYKERIIKVLHKNCIDKEKLIKYINNWYIDSSSTAKWMSIDLLTHLKNGEFDNE